MSEDLPVSRPINLKGQAVAEIRAYRRRALGLPCNVTHSADIATLIERTLENFGRIDILVNNAGVAGRGGLEDTTEDIWYRDIDVIMIGAYRMTQAVFPIMKRQGYGKIVNISSVSGKIGGAVSKPTDAAETLGGRTGPAYATAKGGVLAFTKWVAKAGGRKPLRQPVQDRGCRGSAFAGVQRAVSARIDGAQVRRAGALRRGAGV